MKYSSIIGIFIWLFGTGLHAQPNAPDVTQNFIPQNIAKIHAGENIEVAFYHLKVELDLDNPNIIGQTICNLRALEDDASSIELSLSDAFKVEKITGTKTFSHNGNTLSITLDKSLKKGEVFPIEVFYKGVPSTIDIGGNQKGLLYGTHGKGNHRVIASVAYPNHAHMWFPCKEGFTDKADSIYVDITIENKITEVTVINPKTKKPQQTKVPYLGLSNGVLEGTTKEGNKKTFKWRHRYEIAPHHVLVAVSNYAKVPGKSRDKKNPYPLTFYIFPENFANAKGMIARAPEIMDCLTRTFGRYPYHKEGFSITQAGLPLGGDGLPTQGNILIENVKSTSMFMIVHQATSMWFGNYISPEKWQDAWIPEAMASYAEAMWQEYKRGLRAVEITLSEKKEYFGPGQLYLDERSDYSKELINKRGAYAMHMLRGIMSDRYFFETLKAIIQRKRLPNKFLNTEQFREVCEYYASENKPVYYEYFFKQWIYGDSHPIFEVDFKNEKKGALTLDIRQLQDKLFKMPVRVTYILEDGTKKTETIVMEAKKSQSFSLQPGQIVKDLIFDDGGWILKDLRYVKERSTDKFPINDFKLELKDNRRKVKVSFNSTKKQDIEIHLIQIDLNGNPVPAKPIVLSKAEGAQAKEFAIPVPSGSRAQFILEIRGKSDIYRRRILVNRLKGLLD